MTSCSSGAPLAPVRLFACLSRFRINRWLFLNIFSLALLSLGFPSSPPRCLGGTAFSVRRLVDDVKIEVPPNSSNGGGIASSEVLERVVTATDSNASLKTWLSNGYRGKSSNSGAGGFVTPAELVEKLLRTEKSTASEVTEDQRVWVVLKFSTPRTFNGTASGLMGRASKRPKIRPPIGGWVVSSLGRHRPNAVRRSGRMCFVRVDHKAGWKRASGA